MTSTTSRAKTPLHAASQAPSEAPLQETAQTSTEMPTAADAAEPRRPRVIILGGGVAGLTMAYDVRRRLGHRATITVISDSDRFVLGLALPWVPFGRTSRSISFSIGPALRRHGIEFICAYVEQVDPHQRVVIAQGAALPYDYLVIATGPRPDPTAIPGIAGQFNATTSLWPERRASAAGPALAEFLEYPGAVVVGAAQGAPYLSGAYEFALLLDDALRRHGTRSQAAITFLTPEPYLGHLETGTYRARRVLERLFRQRQITAITGATIERVDADGVHLAGGRTLPAAYTMLLPPASGVAGISHSPLLTDARGFVPVDERYRHVSFPEIYAVGMAVHGEGRTPSMEALPKTGYLATVMARAAARDLAATITGGLPPQPRLPRLRDLRLLDGGSVGVLLVAVGGTIGFRLALPLPWRSAHWMKRLLARYILWKLRTGHTNLP